MRLSGGLILASYSTHFSFQSSTVRPWEDRSIRLGRISEGSFSWVS